MIKKQKHYDKKRIEKLYDLPQDFTDRLYWIDFLKEYTANDYYWYIPKAMSVKIENVQILKERLKALQRISLEDKWDLKNQHKYYEELENRKLIAPYVGKKKQDLASYTALMRINIIIFELLGFVYIQDEYVYITDAGYEFIKCKSETSLREVISRQISKYQFYNLKGREYINPFVSFLTVFTNAGYMVTDDEFRLFINIISNKTDIGNVLKRIKIWRKLSDKEKSTLIKCVEKIPSIKAEDIFGYSVSAVPKYKTIYQNYSYQKSFILFLFGDLITNNDGKYQTPRKDLLDKIGGKYIDKYTPFVFKSINDWFNFYGDYSRRPTSFELFKYQIETAVPSEAKKISKDSVELLKTLSKEEQKEIEDLIYEKEIEDIYSRKPSLIESGLTMVENGRQYSTLIGRIDMLCKDGTGHYVVVEIKRGNAEDKVIGQMLRYIGWVHQNLDGSGKTRGVILAESFSDKIKHARIGLLKENSKSFIKFRVVDVRGKDV